MQKELLKQFIKESINEGIDVPFEEIRNTLLLFSPVVVAALKQWIDDKIEERERELLNPDPAIHFENKIKDVIRLMAKDPRVRSLQNIPLDSEDYQILKDQLVKDLDKKFNEQTYHRDLRRMSAMRKPEDKAAGFKTPAMSRWKEVEMAAREDEMNKRNPISRLKRLFRIK